MSGWMNGMSSRRAIRERTRGDGWMVRRSVTNEEWFVIKKTAINLPIFQIKAPKARGIPDVVRDVLKRDVVTRSERSVAYEELYY